MSRLWDKGTAPNELALRFTVGDDNVIDTRLIAFDCEGSRAHAKALQASGLLSAPEVQQLTTALDDIAARAAKGAFNVTPEQEDCHTLIEAELSRQLGLLGLKIHTGRSRNDQAATMLRLALRAGLADTVAALERLIAALVNVARAHPDAPMPGYTHMQRAMPSSIAAWALGYAEVLCERAEAMLGLRKHLARSPLGSAAGYGVPMPLSREVSTKALGFHHPQCVTAVQLTRGLDELAVAQAMQLVGTVVSRMAGDLVLFATREYAFVRLPAELTTGSSIMPQKQNPDLFELMRARGAALSGHVATISNILAGLPGGYQRDLQLIKRSVVASLDETLMLLEAAALGVSGVHWDAARCRAALSPELYATAAAYSLVKGGMPFRDAYKQVATDKASWDQAQQAANASKHDPLADAADNPAYCARVAADITQRAAQLNAKAAD